jgi:hypothetical protein
MLHKYHIICSIRYYKRFHVTMVGLGVYYLQIWGHTCTLQFAWPMQNKVVNSDTELLHSVLLKMNNICTACFNLWTSKHNIKWAQCLVATIPRHIIKLLNRSTYLVTTIKHFVAFINRSYVILSSHISVCSMVSVYL